MKNFEDYEYLWNQEKEDHVLFMTNKAYAIYNRVNTMVTIIEDNKLASEVIKKMIESGVLITDSLSYLDDKK